MAAWVSFVLGVAATTARDYVRVARALADLPAISPRHWPRAGWAYEQVRALVRVATPQTEAGLVDQATGLTATQVEGLVRGLREVSPTRRQKPTADGSCGGGGWSRTARFALPGASPMPTVR